MRNSENIDYLVFGVDNKEQLLEDIEIVERDEKIEEDLVSEIRGYYSQVEESIILPSLWSNGRKAE